jgi:hypothetical protein
MNAEYIKLATEIISESNSPKVSFHVPVGDKYRYVYDILIHECNADLINKLIKSGYNLSMSKKGLVVNKF